MLPAQSTLVQAALKGRLREIRDRAGNKIRFTWKIPDSTTGGTTHPDKIEWTQTSANSGSYVYRMNFIYSADGNAPASSYRRNKPGQVGFDTDLLTAITVSTSGTLTRKYALTYDDSPTTGAKLLTQVKECTDSAATECLAPNPHHLRRWRARAWYRAGGRVRKC
jgi:hypothetical protein